MLSESKLCLGICSYVVHLDCRPVDEYCCKATTRIAPSLSLFLVLPFAVATTYLGICKAIWMLGKIMGVKWRGEGRGAVGRNGGGRITSRGVRNCGGERGKN
jgi:hypothetical protein